MSSIKRDRSVENGVLLLRIAVSAAGMHAKLG